MVTASGRAGRQVLGLHLPLNDRLSFCILTFGCIFSSLGFTVLQEGVFRSTGFVFPALMTTITTFSYFLCGAYELRLSRVDRQGRIQDFAVLAVFSYGGAALTNHALRYLNYATRLAFKSAKLLPVMLFSVIFVGRRYTFVEWLCAGLLAFGVYEFTVGDASVHPSFCVKGILLMTSAISMDSFCSNYEEVRFFRTDKPCSTQEVMCISSLFGTVYSFLGLSISGELANAAVHCSLNPLLVPKTIFFSILGYCSVAFTLAIIKYFGAPEAEFVKSIRKILSVFISFMVYPKHFNTNYKIGACAITCSIAYMVNHRRRRKVTVAG